MNSPESHPFFASRHTKRSFGSSEASHFGLTEEGVELARLRSDEILRIIREAAPKSVIALAGVSEAGRTKSTAEVFSEELKKSIANEDGIAYIDLFTEWDKAGGLKDAINKIKRESLQDQDKIFVSFPLYMRQFRIGNDRWQNEDGTWCSEYAQELFKKSEFDSSRVFQNWLKDYQKDNSLSPNPSDVAKEQLEGVRRLESLFSEIFPDRPVMVGFVGHSPNIEALHYYLRSGDDKISLSDLVVNEADTVVFNDIRGDIDEAL